MGTFAYHRAAGGTDGASKGARRHARPDRPLPGALPDAQVDFGPRGSAWKRQVPPGGLLSEQQAGRALTGTSGTATAASLNLAASPVTGLGEVRGLQRYARAGGLTLRPGERLSVPFVQATVTGFTRHDRVNSDFDRQERSGRASRHYKFTPEQASMPPRPGAVSDVRL